MGSKKLKFKVSSALKDIIGRDLITDDFIAVFELVKNAFDAYATNVEVTFENIYSGNPKIIIKDNGKGMSYADIKDKWLFVAYSAKVDGTEDSNYDYRKKLYSKRTFAGAKGIGRFSCDRLGKRLILETTKQETNSITEEIITDWQLFESDIKKEFVDVTVQHSSKKKSDYGVEHGTILIIEDLRSTWTREKLLKLKDSLAKLINPNRGKEELDFSVILNVPDELPTDQQETEDHQVVNGRINNFIFETLGLKTTRIESMVSSNGEHISFKLFDGGSNIYQIVEQNKKFNLLRDIEFKIYYLNQSAKLTFAKKMGLSSRDYGHIFLYKNGFRIYPYGEPGEDPLKIDARKAQGYNRFLGTRELIGQIQINSNSEELKETSSRGDGLIKTPTYQQLTECFDYVLRKLERYVVEVQRWGLSIEENPDYDLKQRVSNLLEKISGSGEILHFDVPNNFLEIIETSQSESGEKIIRNLTKIADQSDNNELAKTVKKAAKRLKKIKAAKEEAEKIAETAVIDAAEATKKLKEKLTENLFLKSINSQEFEEVVSLLHHVGIYAGTIDANLRGISLRVQNDIKLSNEELRNIIKAISFETKKIINITSFATKANFKLDADYIEEDLKEYIREYIKNIVPTVVDKNLEIILNTYTDKEFIREFKPIEINIVIDNILNNAKKARANKVEVNLFEKKEKLNLEFIDNGIGIPQDNLKLIYDLGFTTTDGSGIGLFHVMKIIKSMKSKISAKSNKGLTTIKIEF